MKKTSTYKKYIYDLSQSDFDLFVDHIYAKIVIILVITIYFLRY